jgi:3-phosphoshikimate 1-carboxyvinyltransferase
VLATQAQGEFVIRDVQRLREGPEGDRLARLAGLLRQVEARVGEFPEGLVIQGGAPLAGGRLEVGWDPTVAMAFGVAGLLAESEVVLEGAEVLKGCYPEFCADLNSLREKRR